MGQLSGSAFTAYDPAKAASIQAGPLARHAVAVGRIDPTQVNEGLVEVGKKASAYDLQTPAQIAATLPTTVEPVVIGPGGQLYITHGHHTFTALEGSVYGASNPTVYVNVIANYSNLTTQQFFAQMQAQNLLLPLDDGVPKTVDTATGAPIPPSLTGLTDDPYRGLEYSILKNKSSKLFTTTANITGAVGTSTPGTDKMTGFYEDFLNADAYRTADGGLGLPTLLPGDVAIASRWALNPNSAFTLPNVAGTATAARLPGFILPSSIAVSAPITIGTPNTGFVMQLGADKGASVTLSGANTYTGGTSILAGTLAVPSDGALGAAAPSGATVDLANVKASVQAANGIVFNSLSEGAGTLKLGTAAGNGGAFTLARPIAVGGETATIDVDGYNTALNGTVLTVGDAGGTEALADFTTASGAPYGFMTASDGQGGTLVALAAAPLLSPAPSSSPAPAQSSAPTLAPSPAPAPTPTPCRSTRPRPTTVGAPSR